MASEHRRWPSFLRREPRQSRSRALIDAVVGALDRELARAPYPKLTVEALVERAGVTLGSFYAYFADRDAAVGELVVLLTRRNFAELTEKLAAARSPDGDVLVTQFVGAVTDHYLGDRARYRAVIEAIGRLGLIDMVTRELDEFAELLADAYARSAPTAGRPALVRTMRLITSATIGVIFGELFRVGERPIDEVKRDIVDLTLPLLRTLHATQEELPT